MSDMLMPATVQRRVCLLACSSATLDRPAPACEFYTGDVFRKSLDWARSAGFDDLALLSPRHHLVELDQTLSPHDENMPSMTPEQRRAWAAVVFAAIERRWELRQVEVELVMLASAALTEELVLRIHLFAPRTRLHRPLAGMGIGQQKAWLHNANGGQAATIDLV